MKHISIIFFITISSVPLFSQYSSSSIDQAMKVRPYEFFLSTFGLHYERLVLDNISIQLGGAFTKKQVELWQALSADLSGYYGLAEIRYYPAGSDLNGLYFGGYGKYEKYSVRLEFAGLNESEPAKTNSILEIDSPSGGIVLGWQFWLKIKKQPVLLVDLGTGVGYAGGEFKGRISQYLELIDLKTSGFKPKVTFAVGIPLLIKN